ncbi:hypothetical protein FRC11_005214, partial [Ceratobasidium sp. 423]
MPILGYMDRDLMADVSTTLTHKCKEPPLPSFDIPIHPLKHQFTGLEVINIDDDNDNDKDSVHNEDYDWFTHLSNTGYQDSYAPGFSNESSAVFSKTLRSDTESQFSTTQGNQFKPFATHYKHFMPVYKCFAIINAPGYFQLMD